MHPYELQIINFMKTVAKTSVPVDELLLKPAEADVKHYIRKMMEEDPNRPFVLRLSAIGRPVCQQQMEQNKASAVDDDWNFPLRMMYGGIIEGLTVSIIRHAGIKIDEEQTHVILPVNGVDIPGTLDIVLDGKVWDIKSASSYAFKEKFTSYEALAAQDTFGYLCQLYGYSKARGLPPGGWIVIDKSSGCIKVLPVPDNWQPEMDRCLSIIENNVKILSTKEEFKRCFEALDEKFQKRFTGNKILGTECSFCKYRYSCWPELKYLPNPNSKAYERTYRYYTQINTQETNVHSLLQSQGEAVAEAGCRENTPALPFFG